MVQVADAGAIAEAGLDAAATVLQISTTPGLPRQLVAEEALARVAQLLRVQLLQNVYPFHDARLQRLLRPGLGTAGALAACMLFSWLRPSGRCDGMRLE